METAKAKDKAPHLESVFVLNGKNLLCLSLQSFHSIFSTSFCGAVLVLIILQSF